MSRDKIGRRGSEIYDAQLKDLLEPASQDQFVAFDVETGEYEIADEAHGAGERLRQRLADPQVFIAKVGHRAAFHALNFSCGGGIRLDD